MRATNRKHNIITLKLYIKHSTSAAVLVDDLNDKDAWLPLSAIDIDSRIGWAEVQLPEDLALEKGLI